MSCSEPHIFQTKSEWPDVQLAYVPEPKRLRDYLLMPYYSPDGQGQRGHMSSTQARQPGEL